MRLVSPRCVTSYRSVSPARFDFLEKERERVQGDFNLIDTAMRCIDRQHGGAARQEVDYPIASRNMDLIPDDRGLLSLAV